MSSSHDLFVRQILSNTTDAIDFFESSLSKSIIDLLDLNHLELTKESFIGTDHDESRTDLLYKIPLKTGSSVYIYLLFEHKSYYDPKIFTQLLEYLSRIYSWQDQNQVDLKIVLPFVFYHGDKGWDLGEYFLDGFPKDSIPQEFIKYIPNFSIQLLELKKDGNRFQTKNLALRLYMKMIQIIRDDPESFLTNLKDIFYSISKEKDEAKRIYIIKNLLEYLFRARKDAENYTEKEIIKNIEGDYMNLLERIREEGKLEGEQKGKLEGKQENKLETARKMLEEGFTLTQISKITGLTEVQLRENGVL